MTIKIYTLGGAVITGDITDENKNIIVSWFKGKGNNVFTINGDENEKMISRKNIALLEFIK